MISSILKYYIGGGLITIFGLVVAFFAPTFFVPASDYARSADSFATLTSPLSTTPYYFYKRGNGKSGGRYTIRLRLQNHPEILFDNSGFLLDATDYRAILKDMKADDTVSMLVLKNKLSRYGSAKIPQSILEQFNIPPYLEFYSLKFKGKEYVSNLKQTEDKDRQDLVIPSIIFGSLFVFFGLRYMIWKR